MLSEGLFAHCSGAMWIASSRTLVVADIHLGYSWAQRRRGELGPLADERAKQKLNSACDELDPAEIVFLGDVVHAPRPCLPERQWIEETLMPLAERMRLRAVRGNHDRAFAREFGHLPIKQVNSWETDRFIALHGDRLDTPIPEGRLLVIGHIHPSLTTKDAAGAPQKLPLFLVSQSCIVLPAFSPFAGGYDVSRGLRPPITDLFRSETVQAVAVSGKRALQLGPLSRLLERMDEADLSAPAQFRGLRRRQTSER